MRVLLLFLFAVGLMLGQAPAKAHSSRRLRHIILQSRHLGAHGLGYNTKSLVTLSRQLNVADVPVLLGMVYLKGMSVGVQFALASQCGASITPVREAAIGNRMPLLDAEDALNLIEGFEGCSAFVREQAAAVRLEIRGKLLRR